MRLNQVTGRPGTLFCVSVVALFVSTRSVVSEPVRPAPAPLEPIRPELPKPDPESGLGLLRSGAYADAIEVFPEEIEKDGENPALVRGLGEALLATGKYSEAIETVSKSKLFAKSTGLQSLVGWVHQRTGKFAEAEKAYRKAIDIDDSNVEAINRLGEVLYNTGRRKEATRTWNRVIDVYQEMSSQAAEQLPAEGYVHMGVALIHLNRYDEANDVMFSQAEDQDSSNPFLLLESGKMFQAKYNFPDARGCFRDAFKVNPALPDARVALAENYLTDFMVGTKRYGLAEKQIKRVLETNPNHDGAFTARGSLWLGDGLLTRAQKDFEKALEINPGNFRAQGLLAAVRFLDNDPKGFQEIESRAMAINKQCAEFYHTVAEAIERRFRYVDAAKMSEKALSLDRDYWPAFHTLGINLLRAGDEEKGRYYLNKSFKQDPYNIWVFNTRKLLKYMDKNHRELRVGNFILKFPKADYEVLKTYLVPLLVEAYEKLEEHYECKLEPPIFIEVFSGHQWFSTRIVGLAGFPASGACFGNLVALTTPKALPQNWGAVAWHEFAHVITLHKTHHRVPRWLTEGLSVFEEGRDHPEWERRFERELGSAFASGRLLGLDELNSGFSKPKYGGQVLMSYYQGCMIVKYVTKRWSFDKVLEILEGYDANKSTRQIVKEVLEMSVEDFDKAFFAYLDEWVKKSGYVPAVAMDKDFSEDLQLTLEDDPKDVQTLLELGWAYYCGGVEIDVPITLGKVLEVEPENADAHAILGLFAASKGKKAKAREHFETALANKTRFQYRIHETLGKFALGDGENEKAVELFEKAKEISPVAGAGSPPGRNLYYQLAKMYNEAGEEEKAIQTLEEVRSFSVEDPSCRLQLADHYITVAAGEGDEAKQAAVKATQILEEVIYINPFDPGVHQKLAQVSVKAEKHEITIREYDLMLRAYPATNPQTAHLAIAEAHLALGQKDEAAEHAKKVLDLDEENGDARVILEKTRE